MSAPTGADATSPFAARTILWVVLAGIAAFVALLAAGAYAPEVAPGGSGGTHAFSPSAVGFEGVTLLAENAGLGVELIRDEHRLDAVALLVVTPEAFGDPKLLARHIAAHGPYPALIVLPKWATAPMPAHPGWVEGGGLLPPILVAGALEGIAKATIRQEGGSGALRATGGVAFDAPVPSPPSLQTIAGPGLRPLLLGSRGGAVLAQVGDAPLFVLADPDLLNNHGIATLAQARGAMALLAALGPAGARSVAFDIALNGFATRPNLLRLAFEPPFLALTLALAGAALLAGIQAAFRFGEAVAEERAIGFGKAALVDNSAALLALARREHVAGAGYALLTRDAVAAATGAPAAADEDALDAYLDRLGDTPAGRWSTLAGAARDALDAPALLAAARALYGWRRTVLREG